jgi:hypothetical protein
MDQQAPRPTNASQSHASTAARPSTMPFCPCVSLALGGDAEGRQLEQQHGVGMTVVPDSA